MMSARLTISNQHNECTGQKVAVPTGVTVGVKWPVSTRFRDQKVERETGLEPPTTTAGIEFIYRLAQEA